MKKTEVYVLHHTWSADGLNQALTQYHDRPILGGYTMPYAKYTSQEVESQGEAIYEQQIRAIVEVENKGKFLVIDIKTGEYEIDEDDLMATKRLLARQPNAILYGLRVGYPSAYRLGGRFVVEKR